MSLLLTTLLRGVALSGVGILLLTLLRRSSAATRAATAVVFLGAMLALPIGLALAPRHVTPPSRTSPVSISVDRIVVERLTVDPTPAPLRPEDATPAPREPFPIATLAVAVWAAGAAGLILRTLIGWIVALGWARRASLLSDPAGRPTIKASDEIAVPCALWTGRATVLLPSSHTDWVEARRRAVLLHETAHVRRGDWAALVLARLTVALHWPNPLVWTLARSLRRAAEDAADDDVLRAGVLPADYADHLLALAPRQSGIALVLPMAARPDLARRIPLMLDPRRNHGTVSFAALVLAGGLVGGLFGPLTALAGRQRRAVDPVESSPYPDVRHGKTTPGDPTNGFVGRFADGTTAQIVQVSISTPQGIRAWTPDGKPISEARRRPMERLAPHDRAILVRYPHRTDEANGGLGSGPRTDGEPSLMEFGGTRNRPGPTRDTWESYGFIGVPKEDGERASFTFALSNERWRDYALVTHRVGAFGKLKVTGRQRGGGALRNVRVSQEIVHPWLRDAHDAYLKDKNGAIVKGSVPATTVAFSAPSDETGTLFTLTTAVLRDGRVVKPIWNDNARSGDAFLYRYHFRQKPEAIREYRIRARSYKNVEFHDVRLKPNAR